MRKLLIALLLVAVALPMFATEPNPSARQRELIEKLLEATNANEAGVSTMDAMFGYIEKQFVDSAMAKGGDPDDIEEAKEMFSLFREQASKIDFKGLLQEASIRIYAKYFTESELADLTTFYATKTGQKAIEVMPHLLREGMEAGMEHISPKIEEVMNDVREEQAKRRPWRRTMSDIRSVSTALEAYVVDLDDMKYPSGDYASLKELLVPFLTNFPEKDIWGHAYAYVASPDGDSFRLVSSGSDGNFEWDSRRIVPSVTSADEDYVTPEIRYRERLEDDIIYENGSFLQLPQQAKPKSQD